MGYCFQIPPAKVDGTDATGAGGTLRSGALAGQVSGGIPLEAAKPGRVAPEQKTHPLGTTSALYPPQQSGEQAQDAPFGQGSLDYGSVLGATAAGELEDWSALSQALPADPSIDATLTGKGRQPTVLPFSLRSRSSPWTNPIINIFIFQDKRT